MITPSAKYPGYHHVHTAFPLADGGLTGISTKRPVWGKTTSMGVNWVWAMVCHQLETSDIETVTGDDETMMCLLRRREVDSPDGVWDDSAHELALGLVSLKLWHQEEGATEVARLMREHE